MEAWKKVWRDGFAPGMSDAGLAALAEALRVDDSRLIQGCTTVPPPSACVQDWDCEAACVVGFACWQGEELSTVGEVEEAFARACFEADERLGDRAACRYLFNWVDDTPRDEMRVALLAEVERTQAERRVTSYQEEWAVETGCPIA